MKKYLYILIIAIYCIAFSNISNAIDIKDTIAINKLIDELGKSGHSEGTIIIEQLKEYGELATDPLLKRIRKESFTEMTFDCRKACRALGQLGDKRAVEKLLVVITWENYCQGDAISALGYIEDQRAVGPLITALEGDNVWIAARALSKIGDKKAITPLIGALDRNVNNAVMEALNSFGKESSDMALSLLKSNDPKLRKNSTVYLQRIKNKALLASIPMLLNDPNDIVRLEAVKAINHFESIEMREYLLPLIADKNSEVRYQTADTLFTFGDKRAVKTLTKELLFRLKSGCLDAKDWQGNSGSKKAILKCKGIMIERLGDTGSQEAVNPLIKELKGENVSLAATALGSIGDEVAVEPLIDALEPAEDEQKIRILKLIGNSDVEIANKLRKDKNGRIISALNMFGGSAAEIANQQISSKNSRMRRNSLFYLKSIKDEEVLKSIKLALKDRDVEVRVEAIRTIKALRAKQYKEFLFPLVSDKNHIVRYEAAETLYLFGEESIKSAFVDELILRYKMNKYAKIELIDYFVILKDKKSIPILKADLTNWYIKRPVSDALVQLGWKPNSLEEKIHWYIANEQKNELLKRWEDTKIVLISDIVSNEKQSVVNAVYSFIAIGKEEILSELTEILDVKGTVVMAETYLNSGNSILSDAAHRWAKEHGYHVITGSGFHDVAWGRF